MAEEAVIARDCLLAAHVGSALHICHVSTAGSVEIIRWAKSKGWRVTAEVTPHHLLLTDELVASYDPVYKVNPPLRTAAGRGGAAGSALADGTIDCVATDHAPHPLEDKETEWAVAAFGMTGLETALRVVQEAMVETGLLGWAERRRPDVGPARRDRAAAPATGSRWHRARRRTSSCTTPSRGRRSIPRCTRPGAATRRSRAECCPDRWSPRSCAAARPCSTGSRPDGGPRPSMARSWCSRTAPRSTGPGSAREGEAFGEMVFNTAMTGYQETLTDPSYCRQIVAMTAPHIGNTGVNDTTPSPGGSG